MFTARYGLRLLIKFMLLSIPNLIWVYLTRTSNLRFISTHRQAAELNESWFFPTCTSWCSARHQQVKLRAEVVVSCPWVQKQHVVTFCVRPHPVINAGLQEPCIHSFWTEGTEAHYVPPSTTLTHWWAVQTYGKCHQQRYTKLLCVTLKNLLSSSTMLWEPVCILTDPVYMFQISPKQWLIYLKH